MTVLLVLSRDCDYRHTTNESPMSDKWDRRYLALAEHVAGWSKDPSTRVGAVVVDPTGYVVGLGFNGFPRGVDDATERYADRETKLRLVVHAEVNSIIAAGDKARGAALYTWPFAPCSRCAGLVIQAGVVRCVAPSLPEALRERWGADVEAAARMFREAGVELALLGLSPG